MSYVWLTLLPLGLVCFGIDLQYGKTKVKKVFKNANVVLKEQDMAKEFKNVESPIEGKDGSMMDQTDLDLINVENTTSELDDFNPQIQQTAGVVNVQYGSIELNNVESIIDYEEGKSTDEPKLDLIDMEHTTRESKEDLDRQLTQTVNLQNDNEHNKVISIM